VAEWGPLPTKVQADIGRHGRRRARLRLTAHPNFSRPADVAPTSIIVLWTSTSAPD
ncbi:hypothetical protein CCACVL1_13264, partial [Corchorus capsularis]